MIIKTQKKDTQQVSLIQEATTRFELVIRVLQTHALPLGYYALLSSHCWTRTNDTAVNSRVLYRLS